MITSHPNLALHLDSGDALDVRDFAVQQRMSALFEVTLLAVSEDADLDFDAVVGRPARFQLQSGAGAQVPVRFWTGICKHIQQIAVEETGLSTYQITLVPTLWLATQRRNHRMFQQLSELGIARKLLGEWGIEPTLKITSKYKKRKYRVQYAESDFAFLSRLLEDAGISFYFEQGETETKLVLSDAPQANEPRAPAISFKDRPTAADLEHVTAVRVGQRVRPGRYTMRDHDTRLPAGYKLLASAEAPAASVEARLERFHYAPGAFLFGTDQGEDTPHADDKGKTRTDEKEGSALAQKRLEAKRSSAKVCAFETNVADLAPGVVLRILDHPRSDLAEGKPLLVVESTLSGTAGGEWHHRCEARRADLAFRPAVTTPRPRISGVESATVVGPAGEEIHTDEFGRVRVHFHWDRESVMDDHSSCWIHVSQPWGGAGYGGSNLPRVGQEVLVDFLGGDPDRPVITGRMYTNLQKVPYKLPDNKTQSGWKSNSTGGTGGYNEIMFEDRGGSELLRMQAEKDLHKLVKNDEKSTIGHDRMRVVGNDESVTVGNNRVKVVQNDEDVTIGNNRTKRVQVDDALTVGNNRTKSVQRDETVTIGNDHTRQVQNDEKVTIGNDHTRSVQNDESVTIGNDHTRSVQNDENVTIGNDHTRQVKSSEAVTIGKDLMHTVLANAREVTGLMRNVVVGVSRGTQVGTIDHTTVGEAHVVMVSPPGESLEMSALTRQVMEDNHIELATKDGATVTWKNKSIALDADKTASSSATIDLDATGITLDMGWGATITMTATSVEIDVGAQKSKTAKIVMTDHKIVLGTGGDTGAKVTLDGKDVTIEAGKGGTVVVKGGPNVRINPDPGNDALRTMDPGPTVSATSAKAASAQQALAEKYQGLAKKLGGEHNVPPALVLGLMSRESGFGSLLDANGYGDSGKAYGILQVDKNAHVPVTEGGIDGDGHTEQAMGVFDDNLKKVQIAHPDWTSDQQLAGSVSAYNAGPGNVRAQPADAASWEQLDKNKKSDGKYSRDVWARALWFADNLNWAQNAGRMGDPSTGHDACAEEPATQGSADVYFNNQPALRVNDPFAPHSCHKHPEHAGKMKIGSRLVTIDGAQPAIHAGHAVDCGGSLKTGSPDVFIGG